MTDAPERIWADPDTWLSKEPGFRDSTEYIRRDACAKYVEVKPLEWSGKGTATTPFGNYVVAEAYNAEEPFWFLYFAGRPYGPGGEHKTEEVAMAAAQADYERRIREALK